MTVLLETRGILKKKSGILVYIKFASKVCMFLVFRQSLQRIGEGHFRFTILKGIVFLGP